jgi:hypothetical protein
MEIMEKKHAILVTEFGRYVVEHPDFASQIPPNAQIVLQVKGDEEYNEWSRNMAQRQRDPGQTVLFVTARGLRPARSRLLKPEIAVA